jgi:hypothetical protein
MKFIGRVLQISTVAWCIGFFFLPRRVVGVAGVGLFFAVGLWGILYPQGMLEVAKAAHPEIDPEDQRGWWVTRFIGAGFILFSIMGVAWMLADSR